MGQSSRRRWFQVHLSTCVVLMFVAGGLMWANGVREENWRPLGRQPNGEFVISRTPPFGWPFRFTRPEAVTVSPSTDFDAGSGPGLSRVRLVNRTDYLVLAADVAVALAILFAVASVLEWRIRRRRAQP